MKIEKIKTYFVENFREITFKDTRKSKYELVMKLLSLVAYFGI